MPSVGPFLVPVAFCVAFAITNPRFLALHNISISFQQTIVAGKLTNPSYDPVLSMAVAVLLCPFAGFAAGSLISHNMPNVFEIADRIPIMQLGRRAAVVSPKSHSMSEVFAIMTGAVAS